MRHAPRAHQNPTRTLTRRCWGRSSHWHRCRSATRCSRPARGACLGHVNPNVAAVQAQGSCGTHAGRRLTLPRAMELGPVGRVDHDTQVVLRRAASHVAPSHKPSRMLQQGHGSRARGAHFAAVHRQTAKFHLPISVPCITKGVPGKPWAVWAA
eukprot:365619-Chlamydomonas_euryale.AAC.4